MLRGVAPEKVSAAEVDKLPSKIGQLVVERDLLADASQQSLGTRTEIVIKDHKLSTRLRRLKAWTFETLFQSVAQTCNLFPPEECLNFFKAAGYVAD